MVCWLSSVWFWCSGFEDDLPNVVLMFFFAIVRMVSLRVLGTTLLASASLAWFLYFIYFSWLFEMMLSQTIQTNSKLQARTCYNTLSFNTTTLTYINYIYTYLQLYHTLHCRWCKARACDHMPRALKWLMRHVDLSQSNKKDKKPSAGGSTEVGVASCQLIWL